MRRWGWAAGSTADDVLGVSTNQKRRSAGGGKDGSERTMAGGVTYN